MKICVIGAGRWGQNHIRTLSQLGNLGGIVESNFSTLKEFSIKYPDVELFDELESAINLGFDGYVLSTPAETHYHLGKQLIENGCHTLIEKPLALHSEDAKELIKLSKENNVNLMVGHILLFHPAIQKIKDMIDSGKVGKLQYIYSNRLNLGTVRLHENVFWSFAPHDISIFNYFTDSLPKNINSFGRAFIQEGNHDTTITYFEYPNNIKTHIFVSWLHPFKEHRIILIGSKGMISFEDSSENKEILFYEKGIDWRDGIPVAKSGSTENIHYEPKMPLEEELKYFMNHLNSKIEIASGECGLEVVKILEKASGSLTKDSLYV